MKRYLTALFIFLSLSTYSQQQISLGSAHFKTGDEMEWKERSFNDLNWKVIKTTEQWEEQGYDYDGYAWYRIHFRLPASLRSQSILKDSIRIFLAKIDDVNETFLNGQKIDQTGSFPADPGGYIPKYDEPREYHLAVTNPLLRWDKDNVLAVRVYDGGGGGGIYGGAPFISMIDLLDALTVSVEGREGTRDIYRVNVANAGRRGINGTLSVSLHDAATGLSTTVLNEKLTVPSLDTLSRNVTVSAAKRIEINVVFKEKSSGKQKKVMVINRYILTPPAPAKPVINGPDIVGVRPGAPFLYKIPVTGARPMTYMVQDLPQGLYVDQSTGVISGAVTAAGVYKVQLVTSNAKGSARKGFVIKVGSAVGLTPAMGWNSWNCWGLTVSDQKVRSSAQAMINKGLVDHGWNYINIDDGWEADNRDVNGNIRANEKFPDMHALGDWLHALGLKFGIYSSPGERTCGGFIGSYRHEMLDASTYAAWGIDYLKYDWCSYGDVFRKEGDTSVGAYMKPYKVMERAISAQNRDIYYSLCQYGMHDVWKWGVEVGGNSWRTTGDITDTWASLSSIGFRQNKLYPYAGPGHWNDPDMLIVGKVGWGESLHDTRLTPDEQYTHISLWCLLSAPLLIGCDISRMDDFTINLLTNDEVLAIDQDSLGMQARQKIKKAGYEVWVKPLHDGSYAVGIFNMSKTYENVSILWNTIGLTGTFKVRDLWRQKDLGAMKTSFSTRIPPHGVTLVRLERY